MSSISNEQDNSSGPNTVLFWAKVVSLIILFFFVFGFAMIPYISKQCKENKTFSSLINSFAGGLFFGIAFFQLLPDANKNLEKGKKSLYEMGVSYFILFGAYTALLFIEKIYFNVDDDFEKQRKYTDDIESELESVDPMRITLNTHPEPEVIDPHQQAMEDIRHKKHKKLDKITSNAIKPYILLVSLSFDSFFEGVTLGLMDDLKKMLFLLGAFLAHKWAEALTLGARFVKYEISKKKHTILSIVFALILPLGISLGLIISSMKNDPKLIGIFLSISTGIFIYFSCSEVITEEFEDKTNKYKKLLLYMVGAALCAGISLFEYFSEKGDD